MNEYERAGLALRESAKELVLRFMDSIEASRRGGAGLPQAQIFRGAGLDWGNQTKATSSNQQYWVVALLRDLEIDGRVEQLGESGPWRLR